MTLPSRRLGNALGLFICVGLLGYAYYSQFSMQLEPCPLCILQRVGIAAVGLFFLIAAIHNPGRVGASVYGVLIALAALVGGGVAARHVYLQHLPPDQVPECGPGLEYMLEAFPLSETLELVLTGSGECADIDWTFIGLSMPAWVLVWFIVLGLAGLLLNLGGSSR